MLTQEELKSKLVYNPSTGTFTRSTNHRRWKGTPAGSKTKGRVYIQVNGCLHLAHRLAWLYMTGSWPNDQIDHINRDQSDNRWCNLRDVLQIINLQNKTKARSDSTLGIIGVRKNGSGFMASLGHNKKIIYLGTFRTTEEASKAYLEAKQKLHKGYVAS